MKTCTVFRAMAIAWTALLVIACGGGGGGSADTTPPTSDVAVTVIDGAIQNALVCLDVNNNGACDTGEPSGRTDAAGKTTLKVPPADVGRYAIVAVVGTDARDADTGPVMTAFTLSAPADRSGVVSPLTTLVHTAMDGSGLSSTDAEALVRAQAGLAVSLFADYTAASSTDNTAAASVARVLVLVTQQQTTALASGVGANDLSGTAITAAGVREAINRNMLQNLPSLVEKGTTPTILSAGSAADRELLLAAQVPALVSGSGLSAASLPSVVAVNNLQGTAATVVPQVPSSHYVMANLSFTDSANYYTRYYTHSLAQDTPDANNNVRYQERSFWSVGGNLATWSSGETPSRQGDLAWNGSAWVACELNFVSTSRVHDVRGRSDYTQCGRETGTTSVATFDISGRTLASVNAQVRDGGFTNFRISDATLGSASFPQGSRLHYSTLTLTSTAITYKPGRSRVPNTGDTVAGFGVAVASGGDTRTQSGLACATNAPAAEVATLESLIEQFPGKPCLSNQSSFTYAGQTYRSESPTGTWGVTSVSLGTLGTAPLNTGTAPGFYSTNTKLRVAFQGAGSNAVTYLACKERFTDGSTRECSAIGTGTYTITTLGDARVMTLNNPPPQTAGLRGMRVFVERGGVVYYGWRIGLGVLSNARYNKVAGDALLAQLGLPAAPDPEQPLQLTAGSYQGTWEIHDPVNDAPGAGGTTVVINSNGSTQCLATFSTSTTEACTLVVSNAATGAFNLSFTGSGGVATGSFNFLAGTGSGSYTDPMGSPASGSFLARRR